MRNVGFGDEDYSMKLNAYDFVTLGFPSCLGLTIGYFLALKSYVVLDLSLSADLC